MRLSPAAAAPIGNSTLPNGLVRVDLKSGTWRYLEDLSIFLQEHPPAYNSYNDFEPDGTPYSMTAEHGALFLAEPNHAQIIRVATDGATRLAYDFSYPFADVTPTAIAFRDNEMYVGNLGIFTARTQTERITTLSRDVSFIDPTPGMQADPADASKFHLANSHAGFTTIVNVKFGPDGLLYAVELSDANGYPTPGAGKVVRLNSKGVVEDVVTGLTVLTSLDLPVSNGFSRLILVFVEVIWDEGQQRLAKLRRNDQSRSARGHGAGNGSHLVCPSLSERDEAAHLKKRRFGIYCARVCGFAPEKRLRGRP